MKLCRICLRCYDDAETTCVVPEHGALTHTRPGSRLITDKYRLDRLLGRGGMGAVYAATHVELDRPVAIKLLLPDLVTDPQALERFRREARAAAKINHPNVAATYDYGTLPDGEAYLVMELVTGQTLREYLQATGPLPVAEATAIARAVATGVDAAHHQGIVHRDLKPSNIILAHTHLGELQPKVVDFGIAKLKELSTTSGASDLTAAGALIGTPRYMSSEQCAGNEADARSDIYTLGVILYEMLVGRTPFDAPSATAIALKHVRETAPDVRTLRPDLPPALAELIRQTLSKNPSQRPQTAAEFAARLDAFTATAVNPTTGTVNLTDTETAASASDTNQLAPPVALETQLTPQTSDDGAEHTTAPTPLERSTDRAGTLTREEETEVAADSSPQVNDAPPTATETVTQSSAEGARVDQAVVSPSVTLAADERTQPLLNKQPQPAHQSQHPPRWSAVSPIYVVLLTLLLFIIGAAWLALRRPHNEPDRAQTNVSPTPAGATTPTPSPAPTQTSSTPAPTPQVPQRAADDERAALRTALDDWLRATNARNLEVVMNFYPPALETYYLERNVSRASVRADKAQMLAQPGTVLVQRAGEPDIKLSSDGGTATMTFRKPFTLGPNGQQRSGEVLQELRWQKTGQGWKIVGERDIQILH